MRRREGFVVEEFGGIGVEVNEVSRVCRMRMEKGRKRRKKMGDRLSVRGLVRTMKRGWRNGGGRVWLKCRNGERVDRTRELSCTSLTHKTHSDRALDRR